jgi:hypothetical protein
MNVCHEEIDPGSELGGHDGSSVRCTNWQFLVEAPCSLFLSNVGYSGKDGGDGCSVCSRGVEGSVGVIQDEFVSDNDLLVSVVKVTKDRLTPSTMLVP